MTAPGEGGEGFGPPADHLREMLERELGEVPPESPSEPPDEARDDGQEEERDEVDRG